MKKYWLHLLKLKKKETNKENERNSNQTTNTFV